MNDVKFTRIDGTDCYSGTIKHIVGTIITALDWKPVARCGNGLHFGELKVGFLNVSNIPGRAFKVRPVGKSVEIEKGKFKAGRPL